MKRLLTAILIAPIRVYRRLISPALAPRCRYYPTCSKYAEDAIRELGPIRGLILGGWRLLRCNPFSHGGVDELSDRRLFRATPTRSEPASADRWPGSSVATKTPPQPASTKIVAASRRPPPPSAGGSSGAGLT